MGLDYLKGLDSLIAEYQNTSRKEQTLKMFASLNFIKFCLPLLSAEYRNIFNALNEALTGWKIINLVCKILQGNSNK